MALYVAGMFIAWAGYCFYDGHQRSKRIWEDFADDIDRLENDIRRSGDKEMLDAFIEVKNERLGINNEEGS
jgi:hypothetical protein